MVVKYGSQIMTVLDEQIYERREDMSDEMHFVKFNSAEEAWFWFIDCEKAKADGAYLRSGFGRYERPCLPMDIYKVVIRLRQEGRLLPIHMLTLKAFGKYGFAPNPKVHGRHQRNDGEMRDEREATHIWAEAMSIIEPVLVRKGIVEQHKVEEVKARA